ncbi:MAG: alpha/beta hydrolase [Pseudomonadota bacterium]
MTVVPMPPFLALSGPSFGPSAGGDPGQLVVLLHGLGADGNDLIGLAPHWAPALPHAEFLSPDAPFPCDMAPFGRQWFSFQDRAPEMVLAGVQAAAPILDAFLDEELKRRGLGDERLAMVGFSQGAILSLYVAPRRPRPCAAVLGYSGALIGAERLAGEIVSRPPIVLVHGDADPLVPFAAMAEAKAALVAAGIAVEAHRRPGLGHAIDEAGLALGGRFLASRLGA